MPTFSCAYSDIKSKPDVCYYYAVGSFSIPNKPWESIKKSEIFLKNYLSYAEKIGILNHLKDVINSPLNKQRNLHSVSLYFLGAYLMEQLRISSFSTQDQYSRHPFLYSWFITCLSHDFGYALETSKNYKQLIKRIEGLGLEAFYDEFGLSPRYRSIFKSFPYEQTDFYFRKRAEVYHCIDHGIAGGILLYHNLLKELNEWEKFDKYPLDPTAFTGHNGRLFRIPENAKNLFAELADSVIAHNIFLSTMNQWRTDHQLEPLHHKPFSLSNNPLAFILGLADTLEPVKRFSFKPSCLNHINIDILNNDRIIINCDDNFNTSTYYQGIKKLEGWLAVKVVLCNSSITIVLI